MRRIQGGGILSLGILFSSVVTADGKIGVGMILEAVVTGIDTLRFDTGILGWWWVFMVVLQCLVYVWLCD